MERADLIAKLETAEGPSRELDFAIAAAVGWPDAPYSKQHARRYTESTDAALTLVPEGWQWKVGFQKTLAEKATPIAMVYAPDKTGAFDERLRAYVAATPALALCIAALKAREAHP